MENNIQKEVSQILGIETETKKEKNNDEFVIKQKDGLFEHSELLNKKFITNDGRQLLKETLYEQ